MMAGFISVPFFALTSKELKNLIDFGDVDCLLWEKLKIGKTKRKECQRDCL